MEINFKVPEISCGHCKETIENTLSTVSQISETNVDIESKSVNVKLSEELDIKVLADLLDEQGYTVEQQN
jgi:copper chaperone